MDKKEALELVFKEAEEITPAKLHAKVDLFLSLHTAEEAVLFCPLYAAAPTTWSRSKSVYCEFCDNFFGSYRKHQPKTGTPKGWCPCDHFGVDEVVEGAKKLIGILNNDPDFA